MGRAETLAAVREKYPQYGDLTDDALGSALAAKYPEYRDLAPTSNLLARWKAELLKEPPAGDPRQNPVARTIRSVGRFVIPGSYPEAIALGASALPGAGFLPMLGRVALATGGSAAVEHARGADAGEGAFKAATQSIGGEALGAAGRAGTRYLWSRLDPLTNRVAQVIADRVPAFRAATPQGTLARAMSTEGQNALSREYGEAVDTAIRDAGDPFVVVAPGYAGPASMVHKLLKSEKRGLFTQTRDPARKAEVYLKIDDVHELEQRLAAEIERRLPPNQQGVFANANRAYRIGKEVQALFKGAPGRLTSNQARQLLTPEGKLNAPVLQANLLLRSGKLQEALGPEGYQELVDAIRRGAPNPLARDVPGKTPHLSWWGPLPHLRSLPQAPRQIGQPEIGSDIVSQWLRRLGTRAGGTALEGTDAQR